LGKKESLTDLARENGRENRRQKWSAIIAKKLAIKDIRYYPKRVTFISSPKPFLSPRHSPFKG
jgi:hypothetical protein